MTEQQERLAREREEIAKRVASFKATQEKFKRERDEYFVTTLQNACRGFDRPPSGTKATLRSDPDTFIAHSAKQSGKPQAADRIASTLGATPSRETRLNSIAYI